ncbi:protein of unknown function [Azospirillum baldaniorum]|uniref:Uncharacterized protein n=1 Tax=Azospirillum baldaniorum TaxID=1064539 RepID=A0A9P1JQX2_9PROT|nr:protein of unknown function [Azospirillum baldaniorum]
MVPVRKYGFVAWPDKASERP